MYKHFLKRVFDLILSLLAFVVLSPILVVLTLTGYIAMGGNPFFTQDRPGRNEKIFKLIKYRTMTDKRDEMGRLLPDAVRLNKYGRLLRATSLDELPSLLNIIKGDMAIVGPRPLLVEYLPWYNDVERHRHDVRPGLTGWAQVNGRNTLDWEKRFQADVYYVNNLSFAFDIKIIFMTIKKVIIHEGISEDTRAVEPNFATQRKEQIENKKL